MTVHDDGNEPIERRLAGANVLLVVPHPDDESLALGGFIQHALQLGAKPTVLQVTDGDNNPWPQRWLERRWRIGPAQRQHWGQRRAAEMAEAMRILGLPAATLRRMAWPDMGVGARLRGQGVAAIEAFAAHVAATAPDIVVLPALGDSHPDHGGCHVLAQLALARLRVTPLCLEYLVHGRENAQGERACFALDPVMRERKRQAVLAHRSQVALSRGRMLAQVRSEEILQRLPPAARVPLPRQLPLPWTPPLGLRPWLHLILAHVDGVHEWPWREAPLQQCGGRHVLQLPEAVEARAPLFVRLEARLPSPWIFDHWGWRRLTAAMALEQAVPPPTVSGQ